MPLRVKEEEPVHYSALSLEDLSLMLETAPVLVHHAADWAKSVDSLERIIRYQLGLGTHGILAPGANTGRAITDVLRRP